MKPPFKLPAKYEMKITNTEYVVVDAERKVIAKCNYEDDALFIQEVTNSHDKLVNACEKAKWLYDELALSTLGAACKYGDNYQPPTKEDCLSIRELLEQALKEAEKQ